MTAAKLAANAVETAKIKDGAVTNAKIGSGVIAFDRLAAAAIATQQQAEAGTANDVLMTPLRVAQLLSEQMPPAVPTGMILPFLGTSVPEGFLLCNGSNVSRTTYANLFQVIGTKCGAGDGSTTFTLPNLHHRFLEGTTTASEVGSSVQAGLPNITGLTRSISCAQFSTNEGDEGAMYLQKGLQYRAATNNAVTQPRVGIDASRSSGVYGASMTVQPPSIRVLPCIKF